MEPTTNISAFDGNVAMPFPQRSVISKDEVANRGVLEKMQDLFHDDIYRQLEDRKEFDNKRNEVFTRLSVENCELRKELREKDMLIFKLQNQLPVNTPQIFDYAIDRRKFGNAPRKWIEKLLDAIFELTQEQDSDGKFLIRTNIDIAGVFKIITGDKKLLHNFTGSIADFEYFWDDNIVERTTALDRKRKLSFKAKSLKAALNDEPWKNINVGLLKELSNEGSAYAKDYIKAERVQHYLRDCCK